VLTSIDSVLSGSFGTLHCNRLQGSVAYVMLCSVHNTIQSVSQSVSQSRDKRRGYNSNKTKVSAPRQLCRKGPVC